MVMVIGGSGDGGSGDGGSDMVVVMVEVMW